MGLFMSGTIGFGMLHVSGRSLVPKPPAMMTAFIVRPEEGNGVEWELKYHAKIGKNILAFNRKRPS